VEFNSIFVVLELNSLMPVTGGYYQWVKRAMGMRWAFYEGWWTWLYTFADLAIYPVLLLPTCIFFTGCRCLQNSYLPGTDLGLRGIEHIGIVPVGKHLLY